MRTSYSALETYAQCPQKYKFQEIDKRRAPKSREALFGTAVHGALEYMFSRDPLFPTLEEILARFRETFDTKKQFTDTERERYQMIGEKMITTFYKKNPPWNFDIVDTESRFEVVLVDKEYDKTHILVGKIDRIDKYDDGTYEVIDYKTSRKLPSQEMVDANLQLTIYHLGLQKRWPHIDPGNIKLSMYFLRASEKFTTRRDSESLKQAEIRVLERMRDIEKNTELNNFPPMPSALCDWCGYKPLCPAWKHLYDRAQKVPEQKEVDAAINEYFEVKKEIDAYKKRLSSLSQVINDFMTAEKLTRVFGDMGSITRSTQERTSWDAEKVKSILGTTPTWSTIISVDPKKLSAILPSLPSSLQDQLKNEARVVKIFSALKISRKKERVVSGETTPTNDLVE